jgi:sugar/nucleoside kinase (ribokinase family)
MKSKKQTPRLVSSGFIALDVVLSLEDPFVPRFYTGGTTGNVTAALSYLGWQCMPIGRLSGDEAGEFVKADLKRWGVETKHLLGNFGCPTPIVVEKIFLGKDGSPKHRFLWTCPDCGAYLPSYRPVLSETAESLKGIINTASVFFTDRVSRSTIILAEHFKKNDAVVVFEPSGVGDPALFVEMLRICDVLKYSDQRAKGFSDLLSNNDVLLEIQTLGAEGLRFLLRGQRRMKSWTTVPSYDVDLKDTAGAGDWTTAGLIYRLFGDGGQSLKSLTKTSLLEALHYSQALAALNCQFEGARGAMYQLPKPRFFGQLKALACSQSEDSRLDKTENPGLDRLIPTRVCPSCIDSRTDLRVESRGELPSKRDKFLTPSR